MRKNDHEEKAAVTLYSDGAAKHNPDGPGGYGTILEFIDQRGELHVKEISAGYN